MRPLADAACELPWLAPCAGSLVALTREPSSALWPTVRGDPGLVLLLARQPSELQTSPSLGLFPSLLHDPGVLELAVDCLASVRPSFVDWRQPSLLPIYRSAMAFAQAAAAIARAVDRCDEEHAWVGGLLAPLGWLAAGVQWEEGQQAGGCRWTSGRGTGIRRQGTGIKSQESAARIQESGVGNQGPSAKVNCAEGDAKNSGPAAVVFACPSYTVDRPLYGSIKLDSPSIARRLSANWRLPAWLSAVCGHLGLPLDAARALGADPDHFLVVQLAVTVVEQAGFGLGLPVGTQREELVRTLELPPDAIQRIVDSLRATVPSIAPANDWQSPALVPLLSDLLRLALRNRRIAQISERDRLHAEVDALHEAVQRQQAGQDQRLKEMKLASLAEVAAGAGHEINNPLAVISGQAQYLLVSEQEPTRRKSLQTIVNQTQRIHQTLTQLMQFARPPAPRKQRVDLAGLVTEVVTSLQPSADEKQVRLAVTDLPVALTVLVDPGQIRGALTGLVRNAIEAAPSGGWASLCAQRDQRNGVKIIVEDSGPGPKAADLEHLFDPFYSGRKAGRGRGLGLPAAWQLARQHGGDVRYDATETSPSRFVLSLPPETVVDSVPLRIADCELRVAN